jgi:hypothetical protein
LFNISSSWDILCPAGAVNFDFDGRHEFLGVIAANLVIEIFGRELITEVLLLDCMDFVVKAHMPSNNEWSWSSLGLSSDVSGRLDFNCCAAQSKCNC